MHTFDQTLELGSQLGRVRVSGDPHTSQLGTLSNPLAHHCSDTKHSALESPSVSDFFDRWELS